MDLILFGFLAVVSLLVCLKVPLSSGLKTVERDLMRVCMFMAFMVILGANFIGSGKPATWLPEVTCPQPDAAHPVMGIITRQERPTNAD